jgi:hypothetical protein
MSSAQLNGSMVFGNSASLLQVLYEKKSFKHMHVHACICAAGII